MQNQSLYGYLPLKKFHILPIWGVLPEQIKQSVKQVSRDRETKEQFGYNSLLNACAKSFGFTGGFAGYRQEVSKKLIPFMQQHNLVELSDLVSLQFQGDGCSKFQLKRQNISERLFYSGKPLPKKLFTGYNFRYDLHFDDGIYVHNQLFNYHNHGLIPGWEWEA